LGPTMPLYEVYNPAIAQFNADHAFSIAEYDVMKEGMGPEQAIDKVQAGRGDLREISYRVSSRGSGQSRSLSMIGHRRRDRHLLTAHAALS